MEKYNNWAAEEIGRKGEAIVNKAINEVFEDMLFEHKGMLVKSFSNYIFKSPSVFGYRGLRFVEIDKVVVINNKIFVFEVKLQNIDEEDSDATVCVLKNGTKVSNPIEQNHIHKLSLAELLRIKLQNIVTVECIISDSLDLGKFKCKIYEKDYVLKDLNRLKNDIKYIFTLEAINSNEINKAVFFNNVRLLQDNEYKRNDSKDKVKESISRWMSINRVLKRDLKYYPFKITDTAKCPKCGSNFVFSDKPIIFRDSWNKNRTQHFHMFCLNSNCRFEVKFKDDIMQKVKTVNVNELKNCVVSIEQRRMNKA